MSEQEIHELLKKPLKAFQWENVNQMYFGDLEQKDGCNFTSLWFDPSTDRYFILFVKNCEVYKEITINPSAEVKKKVKMAIEKLENNPRACPMTKRSTNP